MGTTSTSGTTHASTRTGATQGQPATHAAPEALAQQHSGEMSITGGFASPQEKPPISSGWKDRIAGIFGKKTLASPMSTPLLGERDDLEDAESRIASQKDTKHDGLSPLEDPDGQEVDYRPPSPSMVNGQDPETAATASSTASSTTTMLSTTSSTTSTTSTTTPTTTSTPVAGTATRPVDGRFHYGKVDGHPIRVLGRESTHVVVDTTPEGFAYLKKRGAQIVSVGTDERRRIGAVVAGGKPDFVRCTLPSKWVQVYGPPERGGGKPPPVETKALPAWGSDLIREQRKVHTAAIKVIIAEQASESRRATAADFVGKKEGDHTFIVDTMPYTGFVVRHENAVDSPESEVGIRLVGLAPGQSGISAFCRGSDTFSGALEVNALYTTPFKDIFALRSLREPHSLMGLNYAAEHPGEMFWGTSDTDSRQALPSWTATGQKKPA